MLSSINIKDEMTLSQFIVTTNLDGLTPYIKTAWGYAEVSYIRNPRTDPWAVCGKENGGFGQSFCVHGGTTVYLADNQ